MEILPRILVRAGEPPSAVVEEDRAVERGDALDQRGGLLPSDRELDGSVEADLAGLMGFGDAIDLAAVDEQVRIGGMDGKLDRLHGRGGGLLGGRGHRGDRPLRGPIVEILVEDVSGSIEFDAERVGHESAVPGRPKPSDLKALRGLEERGDGCLDDSDGPLLVMPEALVRPADRVSGLPREETQRLRVRRTSRDDRVDRRRDVIEVVRATRLDVATHLGRPSGGSEAHLVDRAAQRVERGLEKSAAEDDALPLSVREPQQARLDHGFSVVNLPETRQSTVFSEALVMTKRPHAIAGRAPDLAAGLCGVEPEDEIEVVVSEASELGLVQGRSRTVPCRSAQRQHVDVSQALGHIDCLEGSGPNELTNRPEEDSVPRARSDWTRELSDRFRDDAQPQLDSGLVQEGLNGPDLPGAQSRSGAEDAEPNRTNARRLSRVHGRRPPSARFAPSDCPIVPKDVTRHRLAEVRSIRRRISDGYSFGLLPTDPGTRSPVRMP